MVAPLAVEEDGFVDGLAPPVRENWLVHQLSRKALMRCWGSIIARCGILGPIQQERRILIGSLLAIYDD